MFKEWFLRFIANIVMTNALIVIAVLCIGTFYFVLWIGIKSFILGILFIVLLGLIGLGVYTFYEIKNEK